MKNFVYFIFAYFLLTAATCRKDIIENAAEQQLIHKWKYTGRTGGFAGKTEKADPAVTQILEFKKGMTFIKTTGGSVTDEGTYQISKEMSIYSGKEETAIRFNEKADSPQMAHVISIRKDTLIIADNVYDGFTTSYVKVK
ncbi:MAG TPA: hypothetical protein VKB19_18965 [Pedobacter sp.]|nr:hypothetical protein [Pedobacter sp.]